MNEVLNLMKTNFFTQINKMHRYGILYDGDKQLFNFFNAKKNKLDTILLSDGYNPNYKINQAKKLFSAFDFNLDKITNSEDKIFFYATFNKNFKQYRLVKQIN